MARKTGSWFHLFTITLILSIFFTVGSFVPAWSEEQVALGAAEGKECPAAVPWTQDLIRKRPYLIYTGGNQGMRVLWQVFQTPAKATIQWGTTTSYGKGPVTVHENSRSLGRRQFEYTIENLTPGTKYYYMVTNDTYSYTGSFFTSPRLAQTTLSFYGYGDTQAGYPSGPAGGPLAGPVTQNGVLGALLTDMAVNPARQTLLVHMGDYVYNGLNEFAWDLQFFNLDPAYDNMYHTFASLPLMGVLGNHEGYDAYIAKADVPNYQNMGDLFRKYYPYDYPKEDRFYYSFNYGPVHFAAIDSWSYPDAETTQSIGPAQVSWLKQNLRASKKPWKVIMLHTPVWDCSFPPTDLQTQLTPIIESAGVHLVLQGHMHHYSHVKMPTSTPGKNITFLTLGGGGAPLIPATCTQPYVVTAESTNHFARFDVNGDTMTVTVIRPDGSIVETFTVPEP
jgi:hypothetical protein